MTDMATTHRNLDAIQSRRKAAIRISVLGLVPLLVFTTGRAQPGSWYREGLEAAGLLLLVVGIFGRAWSTLYIGGRKARELVTVGPYSISRNPLYLFSFTAVAGLGAQTGSLILAGALTLGAYAIFVPVVRQEETALRAIFGSQFDAYRTRAPRFLPRLSQWRDVPFLRIEPKRYRRTVLDGMVLLCLAPAIYVAGWLRGLGPILPLLHLP